MKLEAARAIIASSPRTHLGLAARAVLDLLDKLDLDRLEAAEAQQSVMNEALAVAQEEAVALDRRLKHSETMLADRELRIKGITDLWHGALAARDKAAKELEEAQQPDPDLQRLRALEHACLGIKRAIRPTTAHGHAVFDKVLSILTPHLK